MTLRIVLRDGERELTAFDWELGLEAAVNAAPQVMLNCGATSGHVLDDAGLEIWAHFGHGPLDQSPAP